MKQLDYEVTKKLFSCASLDDVKKLYEEGLDFETSSRLAIDDVLAKVFDRACKGNKLLAVSMIIGEITGNRVEDVEDTDSTYSVKSEDNSPASMMDPEVRMQKIIERTQIIVANMPNYYEYSKKLIKDPELRMLGASELDLKHASMNCDNVICGQGGVSKKYYLMKRTDENIKTALSEGDTLFYKGNQDQ